MISGTIINQAAAALSDAALKSVLIFGLALLMIALWRSASAAARHFVCVAAVVASIVLVPVAALLPHWSTPALSVPMPDVGMKVRIAPPEAVPAPAAAAPAPIVGNETHANAAASSLPVPVVKEDVAPIVTKPAPNPESMRVQFDWKSFAATIWLVGALIVLVPFFIARLALLRIGATARRVSDDRWERILRSINPSTVAAQRVALLESDRTTMPMTWGIICPVLLLPAGTSDWPEWKCRNILLHELAHIERSDCLTQMLGRIACAIYWFNPLVWMAARRMQIEREIACDDRVIAMGSRASDYASQLIDVARSMRPVNATAHAAIAMARPSQLSGRLTAMLDRARNRTTVSPRLRVAVGAATMAVVLPVASFSPWLGEAAASPLTAARSVPSIAAVPANASTRAAASLMSPQLLPNVNVTTGFVQAVLGVTDKPLDFAAQTSCWQSRSEHSSTNITNDDNSGTRTTVRFSSGDCSLELRVDGRFTLRPDLSDVATLENGAYMTIEERDGRMSRRAELRGTSSGIDRVYYENGQRSAWSPNVQSWLATTLLAIERRTAFAASTRVPQIYATRGVGGVLEEVSQMPSDYAKSAYLSTLLKSEPNLDGSTLTRIVQQVGREMKSDYYIAEVFNRVGAQRGADAGTWRAFADAAINMKSDYYKAEVIGKVLARDRLDDSTVGMLLKAASTINSDYYQAETLKNMSNKYAITPQTRQYYLDALGKINSDYYKQVVLASIAKGDVLDASATAGILKSIGDMKSDYYKSEALTSLYKRGQLDSRSRADFFNAVKTIDSDYYKHTVLSAVLQDRQVNKETVAAILAVAPSIKSDYELSSLLTQVVRAYPIDDSLRAAYDRAVDAIESDYYRGAALSAARPRATAR